MAASRFLILVLALNCLVFTTGAMEIPFRGKENPRTHPQSRVTWPRKKDFRICDSLTITYEGKTNSELEVTTKDCKNCITPKPIKGYIEYNDGIPKIEQRDSREIYLISDDDGLCPMGEKLSVVVSSHEIPVGGLENPIFQVAEAPEEGFIICGSLTITHDSKIDSELEVITKDCFSELEVTTEDCESCITPKPVKEYIEYKDNDYLEYKNNYIEYKDNEFKECKEGVPKIELRDSRRIYLISGDDRRCPKVEKLSVIVSSHKVSAWC